LKITDAKTQKTQKPQKTKQNAQNYFDEKLFLLKIIIIPQLDVNKLFSK